MRRLGLVLGLALLAALPACRRAPSAPAPLSPADKEKEKEKASSLFQGFAVKASHRGELVWEAQAARAKVVQKGARALGEDVTMVYYAKGKVVSRARADRATIDLKEYGVEAEGAVEVRASNGIILQTTRLSWDNRQQRASSTARVRVIRGTTLLKGRGFSADRDLHDVRILDDVQAEALSVQQLRDESRSWRKP